MVLSNDVQKYLTGIDYPADRDDLVRVASGDGAPTDIVQLLRDLPARSFNGLRDVDVALAE
ncbi:DUF2795 domain-containing protein [Leifsonia sp. YAF41]|uniref:DUF2795 domain-containing protein n=1 Tax=Leifsonia sp. YAF41 TaxID=3233086 RepID=UPI003F943445